MSASDLHGQTRHQEALGPREQGLVGKVGPWPQVTGSVPPPGSFRVRNVLGMSSLRIPESDAGGETRRPAESK